MSSEPPVAGQRGGDDRCPPGYPHCCGCEEVFDSLEEILGDGPALEGTNPTVAADGGRER